MTQPSGTGGTPAGASAFSVDQPSLDQVAGVVDTATTGTFRPRVQTVFDECRGGATVGQAIPTQALQRARATHCENLTRATVTLATYVNASTVLVEAVRQVRQMFSDADLASADHTQAIDAILTGALTKAATAEQTSLADEQQAADDRATGARWVRDAAAYGSGYSNNPGVPGETSLP